MPSLPKSVQQLCYQVSREALSNVIRHSGASRVEISISKGRKFVRLSILDDGSGIVHPRSAGKNISRNDAGGMGLNGLRERLRLMGGKLKIDSRPGATRITAEIPQLP
jgi:signal transduction histidine kinase